MISTIELLRRAAVEKLFSVGTMEKVWPIWKAEIKALTNPAPDVGNILGLGSKLSAIFASTSTGGRGQGSLSASGVGWECLVAWYLNLCLAGSRTVVIKESKTLVPSPISKCKVVKYRNFSSNTESDLVAITFPDDAFYTEPCFPAEHKLEDQSLGEFMGKLSRKLSGDIEKSELCIIQCKTNWNDNAQIPMLWDMVYSANGFAENNISIGSDNFSIKNLSKFSYAFVTVPSQKDLGTKFKPTLTHVQRVANISGGNYWGWPSKNSVAGSLDEIFQRNFQTGIGMGGIRPGLSTALEQTRPGGWYSYFHLD